MWKRPVIDVHTVLGAICIYVLIGMMFSFIYATIDLLGSDPFFVQTNVATTADYLYFSFVTITTVGYGDFTAATGLGRALASVEALLGQVYLVTVVAAIVAGMSRMRFAATERRARPRRRRHADSRTTSRYRLHVALGSQCGKRGRAQGRARGVGRAQVATGVRDAEDRVRCGCGRPST